MEQVMVSAITVSKFVNHENNTDLSVACNWMEMEGVVEIKVEHIGGLQFQITARRHTIVSDQPEENGGFDEGMTPPELLLASLGSCAGFYAAQYLRKNKLAVEGTLVRVTAEKATNPARLDDFQITVEIPAELSENDRGGIEQSVRHCLIHNTLLHPPKMSMEIKALELVAK